eukprot:g10760.t1
MSQRRISASTAGAAVVGSSLEIGAKPEKNGEMQKFMEHLKQQARTTYVPSGFAEKLLEQAQTTAEETKARHQNVVVTLDATYREIDEKTRRHYAELIRRFQREVQTELRRLAKENKEHEELAENLRDKIATQTAEAAAKDVEMTEQREQFRRLREGEMAQFDDIKQNLVEESRRVLGAAMGDAKQASEAAAQSRVEEARRRSMERIELEDRAVRTTVALALSSVISAVEEREYDKGRQDFHRGLTSAKSEADLLRAELAEALHKTQTLLAENAELEKDSESLRDEARALREELEERSKILAAAHANQASAPGDEPAGGEVQGTPQEGSGRSEGGEDEVSRAARLERAEETAMMEDENSFTALLDLVRYRREAKASAAKVAALSKLLENEHATVAHVKHEAKALGGGSGDAVGTAPDAAGGERGAASDGAGGSAQTGGSQDTEAEEEKRAMEKAMEDAVVEQEALQAAAGEKKALGLSMQRVAELEVQTASLKQELTTAKQEALNAAATARKAEQQLLVASSEAVAAQKAADTATAGFTTAATAAAIAGASAGGAVMASAAPATAVVGGGVGHEIEEGPSPDALRLEELKAELQAATAAKKKVKGEIKVWLKEFEEKEGRPAGNEEKGTIRGQFVEHKRLEKSMAKLAGDIQALEVEIENAKSLAAAGGDGLMTMPNTPATPATPGFGGPVTPATAASGTGFQDTPSAVIDAAAAAAVVEKLREENASLTAKLEESERKKALLKTALGELNNTTTKMLADVHPTAISSSEKSTPSPDQGVSLSTPEGNVAAQPTPEARLQEETMSAAGDTTARVRELELEESLQRAQEEVREAVLAAKKAEHLKDEASLALEVAREELKACQLVVDEASEAARLREQVEALKIDLDAKSRAATAGWDAAANAESEAGAAEARGLQAGIKREAPTSPSPPAALDIKTETTVLGELASAASVNATKELGNRTGSVEAWVDESGSGLLPAERKAHELAGAERELENVREREKDARGEAERLADELKRASAKQERLRERETDLVSAVASLEKERDTLTRNLEMAQERAALALELVAAQTEEAARARQESALYAAKLRRASRDAGQISGSKLLEPIEASGKKTQGGRPPTSSRNRRAAEQLRLAAATLVHAIKEGTELWRRERREECHALYVKAGGRAASQMPPGQAVDDLRVALAAAKGLNPAKAAIALRKAFDTVIEAAMAAKESQRNARGGVKNNRGSMSSASEGRGRSSRGGSSAASSGSVSPSRPVSTGSGAVAEKNAAAAVAKNAAAISAAVAAAVGGEAGAKREQEQDDSTSKVASLQRQLEALAARQKEAVAAAAATGDGFSDDEESEHEDEETGRGEVRAKATGSSLLEVATRRCTEMEDKIDDLEAECRTLREALEGKSAAEEEKEDESVGVKGSSPATSRADKLKINSLEKKNKEEAVKARKLEAQVATLETALASVKTAASDKASKTEAMAVEAKVKAVEAKMKKEIDQAEAKSKKLKVELEAAVNRLESSKNDLAQLKKERDDLRQQVSAMGSMGEELQTLRTRAEEAARLQTELNEATENAERLQGLYQMEQVLRKKYWNMDGGHEGQDQGLRAVQAIRAIRNQPGLQAGRPLRGRDDLGDVFEDTRNLVQSALDGYNVCVFAYGQTGSGKTWTMTGGKGEQRGLTPRVIEEIFGNIEKAKGNLQVTVSCYFIELYLDNLRDLLWAMEHTRGTPPKLEVHMESNKMVVVKNAVTKEVASAAELMRLFNAGNNQRKIGGTKMNAESSRSHSIFSILLEVYNKTSKKTATGKLSLVDLAGSERADKTGATQERLKEAQSINKSLSALGDVISALSTNEKFVPYRNNKLTQVMQDSLGGNAKTLMFVNISPADYNQDETVTALTYATRVKLITNTAEKQQDGEEVSRLKETIRKLRAGEHHDEGDGKEDADG